MKRVLTGFILCVTVGLLNGCSNIGDKAASLSIIYCVTAILSLLLLIAYCCITKKKDPWFLCLFASVMIVNIGYFCLASSKNLQEALLANRIAYFGSVFLPMAMTMIILGVTRIRYPKWLPWVLLGIGILVFFVAASPGYLDIYYKDVAFQIVDGVGSLKKVYGSWHGLYLVYLLGYFAAMITTVIHAIASDKVESTAYAVLLSIAVFVNLGVWLIEQLVRIEFEILSISYIITELFLLGLHLMIEEQQKMKKSIPTIVVEDDPSASEIVPVSSEDKAQFAQFESGISELTPTERLIYDAYIAGKSTKEIMAELNIKENTLKFHNKNIYGKLGVSSRKQLIEIHKKIS